MSAYILGHQHNIEKVSEASAPNVICSCQKHIFIVRKKSSKSVWKAREGISMNYGEFLTPFIPVPAGIVPGAWNPGSV